MKNDSKFKKFICELLLRLCWVCCAVAGILCGMKITPIWVLVIVVAVVIGVALFVDRWKSPFTFK